MLNLFNRNKYQSRGFQYKPRYYDAEKEELKARVASAENRKLAFDKESSKSRIRSELRRAREAGRRKYRGLWKGSTLRMAVILVVLCTIVYFVLHQWLPDFMRYLDPDGF